MSNLERAIEIAAQAHSNQVTPKGDPYILHPLRMMLTFHTPDERITAVLHDVVEKSDDWPLERLRREGFNEAIILAVDALTKRPGEPFIDLVKRARDNEIATLVKRADINDHLAYFPPGKNSERYPEALAMLQEATAK